MSYFKAKRIKAIIFDVDGVITDGKKYIDGSKLEIKSMSYKDLDAFGELKKNNYIVGCISGEDTLFSRQLREINSLDFISLGIKDKMKELVRWKTEYELDTTEICYIGDGKYDLPVLKSVGLAVCPKDAINEVKEVADLVLECKGGEGCIAELSYMLHLLELHKGLLSRCKNIKKFYQLIKIKKKLRRKS